MPDPPPARRATRLQPVGLRRSTPQFAELFCRTNFTFLEAASHPDELVQRAAELGYAALAITDRHSLAGVVRAHTAARQVGLKLLIGAEVIPDDAPPVVLLATDREAYAQLSTLLTTGRRRAAKGECQLTFDDLSQHAPGLLACVLTIADGSSAQFSLADYRELFGDRCYALVTLHHGPDDARILEQAQRAAAAANVPLAATNRVLYHVPQRRFLFDALTAVRMGRPVAELGRQVPANAEQYLKSPAQMARLFAACPEAIAHTIEIADRCSFSLDELRYEYPRELCPDGFTPLEFLKQLTWQGAANRYGDVSDKVRRLLEHELALIAELRYEAYFLTVWDLVRFARSRDILCQGRGSAANSAVCYCLGVTSVDPDRIDVLFERFVSKERDEAPDIDIDFEHERREEVIQYVYDKYGRDRAGMTAEVITYRPRSAVRDLGKALGLSLDRVDQLAKSLDHVDNGEQLAARFREVGFDPTSRLGRQLTTLTQDVLGFPRHLSQHVGGLVITDRALHEMVPIENAAMADRTVIQWDKDDLDAVGMLKVDCLALGMLTAIRKCLRLVEGARVEGPESRVQSPGSRVRSIQPSAFSLQPLEELRAKSQQLTALNPPLWTLDSGLSTLIADLLAAVPAEDPAVYAMIQRADTVGVFQIESRAQMSMLPRLKPNCFYDLVIEVAIVRPGPIQGDMVHPYLRRRRGDEKVTYPDERVRAVLDKTLGVPIFQEQAMRLAVEAAGFTPGEADQLRRAMGAWRRRGSVDVFRKKLVDGMTSRGYDAEFAERVFKQIRGFGEYGFPESHAASFALLVYVSAWLKHYHPAAFAAALLNSQPMGFYAPAQLIADAKQHGVEVRPPDVNHSDWDCTLEGGAAAPVLRLGLRLVRGLALTDAERITNCRKAGSFVSLEDLAQRAGLNRPVFLQLARADALLSLGVDRRHALWKALPAREASPLFDAATPATPSRDDSDAPSLTPMAPVEEVAADYRTIGLSLRAHPFQFLREQLDQRAIAPAAHLAHLRRGARVRVAGLVLLRQRPSTAKGITFVTLEDESGQANLIVRQDVWERYRRAARGARALLATGELQREESIIHVLVERLEDLSDLLATTPVKSRDFR